VICFALTQPARLLRDVPEKAEAFLRWALCAASDVLPPCVAMIAWFAAPDRRKASFFQTHHAADQDRWRVVAFFARESSQSSPYLLR
jgi:hypothetical protein